MRLPFISRRRHERDVRLATAAIWHFVHQAEDQTTAELGARLDAEAELAYLRKWISREAELRGAGPRSMSRRLARALRAVASGRVREAGYRRTITRLTNQLLDATGYQGEPLLPEARRTLDLDKEDA